MLIMITDNNKLSKFLADVQALPGIYRFTRNDYSPSFYRKCKTRPITVTNKNEKFVNPFFRNVVK